MWRAITEGIKLIAVSVRDWPSTIRLVVIVLALGSVALSVMLAIRF